MQRLAVELLFTLEGHEDHARTLHRLRDGFHIKASGGRSEHARVLTIRADTALSEEKVDIVLDKIVAAAGA
jgi:hypothetical protein